MPYATGTIALTQGSTAVTGTGTAFSANVAPGARLLGPDGRTYTVAAAASATGLTLTSAYLGATVSGAGYKIFAVANSPAAVANAVTLYAADGVTAAGGWNPATQTLSAPAFAGNGVMQAPADTTAGRLMTVGAFGLGRASALAVTQLNDLAANGFYSITAANAVAGNAPTGNSYTVLHEQYDSFSAIQLAWQASGATEPRLWQRVKVSGTWYPWTLTYTRSNVLGAVSQSSGVPTGALIESGSNANGFFTRLASGLQICRVSLAASAAAGVTWTYPAAFSAAPVITGTAVATVLSAVCLDAAPGTTTATFSARDKTDARRADTCHLTAIGRWF